LTKNYLFEQCHFIFNGNSSVFVDQSVGKNSPATQDYVYGITFDRCVCIGSSNANVGFGGGNATYQGSTFNFFNNTGFGINFGQGAGKSLVTAINNITGVQGVINVTSGNATCLVRNNVAYGFSIQAAVVQSNNYTNPYLPYNTGIWRLWGMTQYDWFSAEGLYSYGGGYAVGAPSVDFYGNAWTSGTPNIGSYNNTTTTIAGAYNPTERNSSLITITPGATSQSIELYLGVTGLTATTTGLNATYNRTRTTSVAIPLVARTIAQPWIAGGFAEVDAVTMPGVYRLDLPNEAVAIGADDVTVNVRGAAGTNGAVITINLKAVESSLISMGPYKVIADGLGSDQPLDIMQGVQAPVSVQVVDVNENGIDITGATVQAKVYNSAGTLVGTYTCTPTYAADGRCTFLLTTDVTNVAGVYSITITRAVGGNVVVFGPLKVMVRAN
jgi:hypothetical protein